MAKTFIGDGSAPRQLKKVWIKNSGVNRPIKKIWVGTNSGPKLIFTDGISLDQAFDFNAAEEAIYGPIAIRSQIMDQVEMRLWTLMNPYPGALPPGITSQEGQWGLINTGGTPYYSNQLGGAYSQHVGRGLKIHTFSAEQAQYSGTILYAMKFSDSAIVPGHSDVFFNTCSFGSDGVYSYTPDSNKYSGKIAGELWFRYQNDPYLGLDHELSFGYKHTRLGILHRGSATGSFYNNLVIVTLRIVTYGNSVVFNYRLKSKSGELVTGEFYLMEDTKIGVAKIFDQHGGGIYPIAGNIYRTLVWRNTLSNADVIECEEFLLDDIT